MPTSHTTDPMTSETRFFRTCFGVFQGGGCRGAAFVGAYDESVRRGVSFAGVAGASAGSVVAALVGAGLSPKDLETIIRSMDFRTFLAEPEAPEGSSIFAPWIVSASKLLPWHIYARIWHYRGLYSSRQVESWLNKALQEYLGISQRNVRFRDLPIPTWIVGTDLVSRDVKIWSTSGTPDDEVAHAVRCSCSIPGFFQAVDSRFVDGGVLSNLPAFVFQDAVTSGHPLLAQRMLAFTLKAEEKPHPPKNCTEMAMALADTVVDGAATLQQRLMDVHRIDINTGLIRATDFQKINPDSINLLLANGRQAASNFFDDEISHIRPTLPSPNILRGLDQVYAAVTEHLDDGHLKSVWIVDDSTRWVYALFPSILCWILNGVQVTVVWKRANDSNDHEQYRRRLLRAMGTRVVELERIDWRGFLFDADDPPKASAVVYLTKLIDGSAETDAVRYRAPNDGIVIRSLQQQIVSVCSGNIEDALKAPKLASATDDELRRRLRAYVTAYTPAHVKLDLRRIAPEALTAMSRVVKGFKYQQLVHLQSTFGRFGLRPFQLAVVEYANGKNTIVTPVVAESAGTQLFLIQGNTRALFSLRNQISEIDCLIATDLTVPRPSQQRVAIRHMLIGDRTLSTRERYGSEIDKDFRQIEYAAHHPKETLL